MDDSGDEERERRLKAIKYLGILYLIFAVLTIIIRTYVGRMNPIYLSYLLIPLGFVIIFSILYKKIDFVPGISMAMTSLGLILVLCGISLDSKQLLPITAALLMGAIIFIAPWFMVKSGWVDQLNMSVLDNVKGCWEMDESGNLHKTEYPINVRLKDPTRNNIYALFVSTSLHSKKKISLVDVNVFNFKPRNREHEKKLLPLVKSTLEMTLDYEIIERSGGIDNLMKQMIWEEIY